MDIDYHYYYYYCYLGLVRAAVAAFCSLVGGTDSPEERGLSSFEGVEIDRKFSLEAPAVPIRGRSEDRICLQPNEFNSKHNNWSS